MIFVLMLFVALVLGLTAARVNEGSIYILAFLGAGALGYGAFYVDKWCKHRAWQRRWNKRMARTLGQDWKA